MQMALQGLRLLKQRPLVLDGDFILGKIYFVINEEFWIWIVLVWIYFGRKRAFASVYAVNNAGTTKWSILRADSQYLKHYFIAHTDVEFDYTQALISHSSINHPFYHI